MAITKKCTAALALVVILFLSSCKTNDPVVENYTDSFTKDYTVSTWGKGYDDESGMYFYHEFSEPRLTQYIYDNGIMQAFLVTNNGISPLPFNDYWENEATGYMSTEQITCEFYPEHITFIIKASDHDENIPPYYSTYKFRVRFMWNNYY